MTHIAFKRITPELSRIHDDDGCVGEVYRQPDVLHRGRHYYVSPLDRRSPWSPLRVFDRSRIREEARLRLLTHPYY